MKKIIKTFKQSILNKVLSKSLEDFVYDKSAILTGLAREAHVDGFAALGVAAQLITRHGLYGPFQHILNRLRDKGAIKGEYFSTNQGRRSLSELLNFLKSEDIDETRWNILRDIAVVAATDGEKENANPIEFMSIVRKLEPVEFLILLSTYRLSKKPEQPRISIVRGPDVINIEDWIKMVATEAGIKYIDMLYQHDGRLMDLRLINGLARQGESETRMGQHFRLTDLGYAICDYTVRYDLLKKKYNL